MSDISEARGDTVQGALTPNPAAPDRSTDTSSDRGHSDESACLNCGTRLIGSHCHACGQAAHVHRTLGAFFHDLLHGVFHFEGKIWRTLPLLAWRPGRVTREYIDGRRASYVSPIALFLFGVFATFALFSAMGGLVATDEDFRSSADLRKGMDTELADIDHDLASLRAQRAAALAASKSTVELDRRIKQDQFTREFFVGVYENQTPNAVKSGSALRKSLYIGMKSFFQKWQENPQLLAHKLQSNAYKYSWLLIPISVPFMWLLFPFSSRFGIYDHTVFVTYSLSFMMLLTATGSVFTLAGISSGATGLLGLYGPFHMYRQLRETYALGLYQAIWRTVALVCFELIILLLFVVAMTALVFA